MTNTLFDFNDPALLLRRGDSAQSKLHVHRASGTIQNSVKHSIVHTFSPEATLHHTVIGASPHPKKERADAGEFYMIAYVSIPIQWLPALTDNLSNTWDVTFVGPAGGIQKLPPSLSDMELLLNERVYIGFDWLWIASDDNSPAIKQPSQDRIRNKLVEFVNALRSAHDPVWAANKTDTSQ